MLCDFFTFVVDTHTRPPFLTHYIPCFLFFSFLYLSVCCGLFSSCPTCLPRKFFCTECTELLKVCTTCFTLIEIGHESIRLQLEPTTKLLEMEQHETQPLHQWTMSHFASLRCWYEHEHFLILECERVESWKPE